MPPADSPFTQGSKVIPRERSVADAHNGPGTVISSLMQSQDELALQLFKQARLEGWALGQETGRKDFLKATAEAVIAVRTELLAIEPMLGPVVMQALGKVFGKMPYSDVVKGALVEALHEQGTETVVTLRAPLDDIEALRETWATLIKEQPHLATAVGSIEPDAGLQSGELILENLKGRTHIGIAYQLARLRYGILGAGM